MNPTSMLARRLRRWLSLIAVPLALSACSISQEIDEQTRIDYKSAGKLPPLDVPPDLVTPRGDERFAIPERDQRTFSSYQTARTTERPPAETQVLPAVEGMRIDRAGTQRWLVVAKPADQLWPVVKEFWRESGFALQTESPATGVMETEWAENRAKIPQDIIRRTLGSVFDSLYSSGERDKFRTRFEKTASGGTEIYISHRGMEEVYTTGENVRTIWQPRPSDPELEAEFLRRLMVRLGADAERAGKAPVAGTPAAAQAETARVVSGSSADVLEVREGFDRAWRRVGLALDRGGFTVEDRDRSKGIYYVRYIDPEVEFSGKPGLLSRMFSTTEKPKSAQQYWIRVEGSETLSSVTVLGKDGNPLSSEVDRKTGAKILTVLREQLG
ncbi:MAG TPA: outer membrane protein assembly factor BamC [Quisquiliibacterium sp.]|nr:outer membrane protein assembly factor BamC [Quisquiliibacterium sp.]